MLKAGFGRIDITPPLGVSVQGYYEKRLADGILDPLYATAVAFDDGEHRAVVMSVDVIGFHQILMNRIRAIIAEAIGTKLDRGATFLQAQGSYSHRDTKVVLAAIRRQQLTELKELVMDVDPDAFVIVQEAHQVLGDGFIRYSRDSL